MNSVKGEWDKGLPVEIDFWHEVISGDGYHGMYHGDLLERLNPSKPLLQHLLHLLPAGDGPVRVLDVAAGPVSLLGWTLPDRPLEVVATDALAETYKDLLDRYGFEPPSPTLPIEAEDLAERFEAASFDLAYCRNGLDHCHDPIRVIENVLQLLKPGGAFYIEGALNEAEHESYNGLHQWNVTVERGDLVIWRPGAHVAVGETLTGLASVTTRLFADDRYMSAVLRKAASV